MYARQCVRVLLTLLVLCQDGAEAFCRQFYSNIETKEAMDFHIIDSLPVGSVVKQFSVPAHGRQYLSPRSGDWEYVRLNRKTYALEVAKPLHPIHETTLSLYGVCQDYVDRYKIPLELEVTIRVHVADVNDPPSFLDLPATVHIPEDSPVGTSLYEVKLDVSMDSRPDFQRSALRIQEVWADAETSHQDMFAMTEGGLLSLTGPLDFEGGPRTFNITIYAEDYTTPPLSNSSVLTVRVRDVDDLPPAFSRRVYTAHVVGEKPVKGPECFDTEPPIKAEDQDGEAKSPLHYAIQDGKPGTATYWGQFFRLDVQTGQLCQLDLVQRLLHSETGTHQFHNFTFTIRAYQTDDAYKFDTAELRVEVKDSNEHAPKFERKLYRAQVPEYPEVIKGARVVQVSAADKDHGLNSRFHYQLSRGGEKIFNLDPVTGWLTVKRPHLLDREKQDTIQFKVSVAETHSADRKSSGARVLLQVTDVNDNPPRYSKSEYRFTAKDNLRSGMPVQANETIQATDLDLGDNGRVRYSIDEIQRVSGVTTLTDHSRFSIDPQRGTLRLAGTLNDLRRRREYPEFRLLLTATDQAREEGKRKTANAYAYVQVIEANDFTPKFVVNGGDTGGGVGGGVWGGPEHPVLSSGTHQVNETAPIGSVVAKLTAHDGDGDADVFLTYSIVKGNEGDHFRVNRKHGGTFAPPALHGLAEEPWIGSGWVVVQRPLDRETLSEYNLKLAVTDGQHEDFAVTTIEVLDVNDNPPEFEEPRYEFDLEENSVSSTVVGKVKATDLDLDVGGLVRYSLKESKISKMFDINDDGIIVVKSTSGLLDREQNQSLELQVLATDLGSPPLQSSVDVTVHLRDVNDNAPVFTLPMYHGTVLEDDARTDPFPQVVVMDIPINASDADVSAENRAVRYHLLEDGAHPFRMDPVHADILVADFGRLDCERQSFYKLQVEAVDLGGAGLSASAAVLIQVRDVNDNAPKFAGPVEFSVAADAEEGSVVGAVSAQDADVNDPNNRIIYLLRHGGAGKFNVDYSTGEVRVASRLDMDPVMADYVLQVQALDGGTPHLTSETVVTVHVPVNQPPELDASSLSLRALENLDPGTEVGWLRASDPDQSPNTLEQHLTFHSQDIGAPFKVAADGAVVTTAELDYESESEYRVPVWVVDGGRPARTASGTLLVHVKDENDLAPVFSLPTYSGSVLEDNTRPHRGQLVQMVVNISAVDPDASAGNKDIRYTLQGRDSKLFDIDPVTAQLKVSKYGAGRIDREDKDRLQLKIRATDGRGRGLSTDAGLVVHIVDENDVEPVFYLQSREFVVDEDVQEGDVIGQLLAEDQDATAPNNQVVYSLDSDTYGKFHLDFHTGELSVLKGLFYPPRQPTYILHVSALDLGVPGHRTPTTVTVDVLKSNFNDYKPEFHGKTIFYVREESPSGSLVGTLSIADEDYGPGEDVTLTIESDEDLPFEVLSPSGEIRTTGRLDCDSGMRAYTFAVNARDHGSPPRETKTYVGIIMEDINDNPPQFTQDLYHHRVSDLFPAGTVVATPFAYDDIDSGNSVYRYSLEGPGAGDYFYINKDTGVVRTTARLPSIPGDKVAYTIVAQDRYNSRLSAQTKLLVDVIHTGKVSGTPCCCKVPCDPHENTTAHARDRTRG